MNRIKVLRDHVTKAVAPDYAPVKELHEYLRGHKGISFHHEILDDGSYVSRSTNFAYGRILAVGKDRKELDANIKDAILTAFDIPSAYAKEAGISAVGEAHEEYSFA